MRGPILKILACLLVLSAVTMSMAEAAQRTGVKKSRKSRPDHDKAYDLGDIMKEPKTYLEREVFFYCRFATTANLFKNINTRFNVNEHVNFAAWPDKTVLWESKGRKGILPTLYVAKNDPDNLEIVRTLKKYELIAVTGRVLNVYAGYPWIIVTKIEKVEVPSDQISDIVIEHMQSGYESLKAEAGGAAARHFEQALQYGLPAEYRAKAYEHTAQAYLLEDRLDKAIGYLRQAVGEGRGDPVLHLALADVALKMGEPAEALAHCEFAMEHSGRYPQVYGIMGEARAMLGDYVKAFQDLNAAAGTPGITPREKAMVSVRRARIYVMSGRFPDAARVYASVSEPGEPLAGEGWLHNEIGLFYERLYLETGDERYLDSAYAAYEEASRLSRIDASIVYNMAETEFRRQKLAEQPDFALVRELIEKITQIEPDYPPSRILEGRVLFAEERLEEAEYRYQAVAAQISDEPVSLMALAEAYIDLGRYMDAANTIRRARQLQPWHSRVKALGKFIEETATAIAAAEAERGFSGWLNPPVRGGQACPEPMDARYNNRRAPQGQFYARGREPLMDPAADPRIAKGLARRPAAPVYDDEPRQSRRSAPRLAERRDDSRYDDHYGETGRTVRVRPGEGVRISSSGVSRSDRDGDYPQDIQASASPADGTGDKGKGLPVTEVRLPAQGRSEPKQASEPKPLNLGYRPANRENVDEHVAEESRPQETVVAGIADLRDEYRDLQEQPRERDYRYEERPAAEPRYESRPEPQRYDARRDRGERYENRYEEREYRDGSGERYYEKPQRGREEGRYKRYSERERRDDYDRFDREVRNDRGYRDERYDRDESREQRERNDRRYDDAGYESDRRERRDDRDRSDQRYNRDYDAEYDEEGYLRFGQTAGSPEAYGSLIVPEIDEPYQAEQGEGGVRIPAPFSFKSDDSPVIISSVRSPGGRRDMPVRNANVFRPLAVGRQPAEIIEKDPVSPARVRDASVMAPPGSGEIKRTEVRLPSTARGVGMTSDYMPAGN